MSTRRRMFCGASLKIKNLPIGSKIQFSNGEIYELMGKNLEGHEEGSATFLSENIVDNVVIVPEGALYNSIPYHQTSVFKSMSKYYDQLTDVEKSALILREHIYCQESDGSYVERRINSYFDLPSYSEMDQTTKPRYSKEGTYLGFVNNEKKIKLNKSGVPTRYLMRTMSYGNVWNEHFWSFVGKNGTPSLNSSRLNGGSKSAIALVCDIYQKASVVKQANGTYKIVGI